MGCGLATENLEKPMVEFESRIRQFELPVRSGPRWSARLSTTVGAALLSLPSHGQADGVLGCSEGSVLLGTRRSEERFVVTTLDEKLFGLEGTLP